MSRIKQAPLPPFTRATAIAKVQAAEQAWNTRDPKKVAQVHAPDCVWRVRGDFFYGAAAIEYAMRERWSIESHCQVVNELWTFDDARVSVRLEYEWQHAQTRQWYRTHGNEHWEYNADGYITHRDASANDIPITSSKRRIGLT